VYGALTSGAASTFWIVACVDLMMDLGVPVGAKNPFQLLNS